MSLQLDGASVRAGRRVSYTRWPLEQGLFGTESTVRLTAPPQQWRRDMLQVKESFTVKQEFDIRADMQNH